MAGAIFTSTIKWTADKLSTLISEEAPPSSAEQELLDLQSTMMRIHAVLDDAEERDVNEKSEQLRLRELKEVAYDAEDVVDEYEYEVLRAKVEARRRKRSSNNVDKFEEEEEVCGSNCNPLSVSISYELSNRINEIIKNFKNITDDWNRIDLREKSGKRQSLNKWKPIETTSYFDEAATFGREDDKEHIIHWLLEEDEPNPSKVKVLAIVGMGGLGKTAVAQMIYNHISVCQYFDLKGWVCVSEDSNALDQTRKIVISISSENDHKSINNTSLGMLYDRLMKETNGKKFFLVLDDVWSQKIEVWDSLRTHLTGAEVVKILVTTRNEFVARVVQTTSPIQLRTLSFDDCWSLFMKIAFEGRHDNSKDMLFDIGQKIVRKCKGLPLAVKVLAGILRLEQSEDEWIYILENELWEFEEENNHIMPALKLSYDRMPTELRRCFMYLALFPKDFQYEENFIVPQWMSQGFLRPKGKKTEEEIGIIYFNELLQRSILQHYVGQSTYPKFVMHDLIHDLAQFVSRDEYLLITCTDELCHIPRTARHVSIFPKKDSEIMNLKLLPESRFLRTLVLSTTNGFLFSDLLPRFKCLRTLVLYRMKPIELSDSIGSLKYLRCLHIDNCISISESAYKLYHLQTLTLDNSYIGLGRGIGDLINLRHLRGNWLNLPREVAGLTNLQTLSWFFYVGVDSWWHCKMRHLKDSIDLQGSLNVRHLKDLANLRKHLSVRGLGNVRWSDVIPPEDLLKNTRAIESLELLWNSSEEHNADQKLPEQLLDCLRPHADLKRLVIWGYPGASFPKWLGDASFSKLQSLQLCHCKGIISLPTLGKLANLCSLHIDDVRGVKSVGPESSPCSSSLAAVSFPSLSNMLLRWIDEWEEWQGVKVGDFPRLHELHIEECPKLRGPLPFLPSLTLLHIISCPNITGPLPSPPCLRKLHITCSLKLTRLPSLPHLDQLDIGSCPALRLPSLPSLTKLSLLWELNPKMLSRSCLLPMLRVLRIQYFWCPSLLFLENQSLRSLKELVFSECCGLRHVGGLRNLPSLQRLVIKSCPRLQILPNDRPPPNLEDVEIDDESPQAKKWYQNHVIGRPSRPDHQNHVGAQRQSQKNCK